MKLNSPIHVTLYGLDLVFDDLEILNYISREAESSMYTKDFGNTAHLKADTFNYGRGRYNDQDFLERIYEWALDNELVCEIDCSGNPGLEIIWVKYALRRE